MKLTDISTRELRRLIHDTEESLCPDRYALAVLRRELLRREDSLVLPPARAEIQQPEMQE